MKKITFTIACIILITAISGLCQASVTGNCSNCHTMHNSQGGTAMARGDAPWGGSGGSTEARPMLLIASCIGCHSSTDSSISGWKSSIGAPIVYNTGGPGYGDSQPDGYKIGLAGGNFYYLSAGGANPGSIGSQRRGHWIRGIPRNDKSGWPGSIASSCGGCHKSDTGLDCQSCHLPAHHKGGSSGGWADADDGYYRFLGPLTSASTSHTLGVSGYEDPDWQQTYGSGNHNEYSGQDYDVYHSISKHCAGCHYYGTGYDSSQCYKFMVGFGGHKATLVLPWPSTKYKGYVGYGDHAPPIPVDYAPKLPIARTNISTTGSWPYDKVNYNSTDALMCLTCHRAHASPYHKMLRWDNTLVLAAPPQGSYYGCVGCHSPDPQMPP